MLINQQERFGLLRKIKSQVLSVTILRTFQRILLNFIRILFTPSKLNPKKKTSFKMYIDSSEEKKWKFYGKIAWNFPPSWEEKAKENESKFKWLNF